MAEEPLVLVPIPSLVSILLRGERDKGSPLTQDEVAGIRDQCVCVALPAFVACRMGESRGYDDIDPGDCWEQWQVARRELNQG